MMRIETTGAARGVDQMTRDEASARECLNGRTFPHVRLYWWDPPAISLGAHQSADLIDASMTSLHGLDIVVRPTGGGAILHADELTYCVTLPLAGYTPTQAFAAVTSAVVAGLRRLGVAADAEVWPSARAPEGEYRHEPLCFGGIARDEIRVRGRKLVGSAQRIYRSPDGTRAVLQHGSILMSDAHTRLPIYMRSRTPSVTSAMIRQISERSTSLEDLLGRNLGVREVAAAVSFGFRTTDLLGMRHHEVRTEQSQEVAA